MSHNRPGFEPSQLALPPIHTLSQECLHHKQFIPVQPQGMQESGEALHDQQDGYRQNSEHGENDEDPNESSPATHAKADVHHHRPEHFRQLCQTQEKHSQPRGLKGKGRPPPYGNPGSVHPTIQQLCSQVEDVGICALGYLTMVIYSSFGGVSIKRTSV